MDTETLQIEINGKLGRMMDGIDSIKTAQDKMADDITNIKQAVYGPDDGLYARLRELEQWNRSSCKIIWMLMAGVGSVVITIIKHHILT